MKMFNETTTSIKTILTDKGFTLYDNVWIAKMSDGKYITVDEDLTVDVWDILSGYDVSEKEFISAMIGDETPYCVLRNKCNITEVSILYALGVGDVDNVVD